MKISSLLSAMVMLVLLGLLPAEAGKDVNRPELVTVGHSLDYSMVPQLEQAVRLGGEMVWSILIEEEGASFIKPHFVKLNLRAGDQLIVRALSGRVVEILEGRGPHSMGSFWGLSGHGDALMLELHFSHGYRQAPFSVDSLIVGDEDLFDRPADDSRSICSPADFEDVSCYESDPGIWGNVMASVGVMTVGSAPASGLWCSGSNVSAQNYLMTNWHCIPDFQPCSNAEFVFKYYNTSCGGSTTTTDWESFRCDQIMVEAPIGDCEPDTSHLDFTLSSVIGDPAAVFGNVNPDPTPLSDGEDIYIIQHPDGRPHEISQGSGTNVDVDGHTLRYYDTLDTEGGSSGSPIFRRADHKMVGLHHCGGCETAGTGNRGMLMSDIYPLIQDYLCTDAVNIIGRSWENLAEVAGNGNDVLDPGETWSFEPRVFNVSCATQAGSISADFEAGAASAPLLSLTGSPAVFGDIDAGTTASATAPIIFAVDPAASCSDLLLIDLKNPSGAGVGPFDDIPGYFSHALGEVVETTLMSEDFSSGIPASWTVIHNGTATGAAETWTTMNPGGRSLPLTEPFAIVDSDAAGSSVSHDEEMITAATDCRGYSRVVLQFAHDFNYYSGGGVEQADVDIRSSATGGLWTNVANYSSVDTGGVITLDITGQAASDVQIRFHYYDATYDYWWAVDDVFILGDNGAVCEPWVSDSIFLDGFENGSSSRWSFAVGS